MAQSTNLPEALSRETGQGDSSEFSPGSKPAPSSQLKELRARAAASHGVGLAVFVFQRLLFGAVVLGAITFLSFFGLTMARGATLGAATGDAAEQSLAYLARLLQGDLGLAQAGTLGPRAMPVTEVLWDVVSKSLVLVLASLAIAAVIGVVLGIWSARGRRSGWSLAIIIFSIVGVSIPSFFAALLLQLLMVRWAQNFGSPLLPVGGFGFDKHLLLPALVLATRPIAQITRMTFISVGDILDKDYVRTAQGKGLWPRQIWSRHVLRNAAVPILTTVGVSVSFILSSLPVVEYFFGWPGLGSTLLKSISLQDDNVTVALVLCLGIMFILLNLVLELSYRIFDPRLREQAARVGRAERRSLAAWFKNGWISLRDLVRYNPVSDWWRARRTQSEPSPFARVMEANGQAAIFDAEAYGAERRRAWWRGTLGNLPFLLGTLLILLLVFLFVAGPRLTPHNPYATQGLTIVDGEFSVPPFAPSEAYPLGTDVLGRDIMSLILAGAQQTLMLAVLVVLARLAVGSVLGAVAGWFSGSWVDRGLMSLREIIAAFPTLLLAMTLILALGIRRGMVPFVIALCFAGWGEIMQFVRGEVMAIKPKPFIESAIAVGLRTPRLFLTQVVPNLLSSLISLTALEMGAVLMVLGELGFIGIFIGGGAFAELDVGGALYHYSDVPEWGSLLSGVRAYARSYPWVAVYPALAFFIAILGFNLFGEGLRRMIESVGVGLNRLLNRYTLAAVVVGFVVIGWARSNTGSMAFYKQQARAFDGQQAYAQVAALADPALEDRSLGSQGMEAAADAIARHFQDLGLQPAGQELTYFQNRNRSFETLDAVPQVSVDDGGPPLEYMQDYVEYAGPVRSLGQAQGPVRVILARAVDRGSYQKPYPAIQEVVEPEDVLMALTEQEGRHLTEVPHAGLLVVAEDPADLRRHATLSDRSAEASGFGSSLDRSQDGPNLYISEALANRILAPTGETVASLRKITQGLPDNQVAYVETQTPVSLQVEGTIQERVPVRHVIGHLPGVSGRASAGEAQLDNQLIVVLAQYDSPPYGPDGCCPATNDNASGVGVMLEVVRAMREANYQPYRTFLFVAYAGEGLDGGEVVEPQDVNRFLQAKAGFATAYDVEAIIDLRGVGAGTGNGLELSAGGNQRLAELFESSARRVGLATSRAAEPVDLSVVFADRSNFSGGGQEAPYIRLSWEGWQDTARTAGDTLDTISPARLQQVGQALAQALMIMGREDRY